MWHFDFGVERQMKFVKHIDTDWEGAKHMKLFHILIN